jgi:hypothetical protein
VSALDRRAFVGAGLSCGAYLLTALAGAEPAVRRLFAAVPAGRPARTEPWGRLERIADGVWTLISTPLAGDHASGAMRTFSNGGIVAGRDGVLAIEGFATVEGAGWLAGEARRLTGRWPTHVALTHYHGDHAGGLGGYLANDRRVELLGTEATRDLLHRRRPDATLPGTLVSAFEPTDLDLGGHRVRLTPRDGLRPATSPSRSRTPGSCGAGTWCGSGSFPTSSMPRRAGKPPMSGAC